MSQSENAGVPYHTWEELKQSGVDVEAVPELDRLWDNWILAPDWRDGIYMKDDQTRLPSVQPYFNRNTNALHAIAHLPISAPKLSAVTVTQGDLDGGFAIAFQEKHEEDMDGWEDPTTIDPSIFQVELPPGWDPEDDDREALYEMKILRCCGEPRPEEKKTTITVKAAPDGPGYVTIHDYITTVHPWLLSLGNSLLQGYRTVGHPADVYGPTNLDDLSVGCTLVTRCFVSHRPVLNSPIHGGVGYGQKPSDVAFMEQRQRALAEANEVTRRHRELIDEEDEED